MSVAFLISPLPKTSLPTSYSHTPFPSSSFSISSSLNSQPPINSKPQQHSNPIPPHPTTSTAANPEPSVSSEPIRRSNAPIKMPTAPWMNGPLLLQPSEVPDFRAKKRSGNGGILKADRALTDKVSGVRGPKAMKLIVRSISGLEQNRNLEETQKSSGEFDLGFSLERVGGDGEPRKAGKMPWSRAETIVFPREKKVKVVTAAETVLDGDLLESLRNEAKGMKRWVKVMKAGVTQAVVDQIRDIWRRGELAMLKFDMPLCLNMERAREIVEVKTRGLVVWSKKDLLVVYRGCNYPLSSKTPKRMLPDTRSEAEKEELMLAGLSQGNQMCISRLNGSLYEREADRLLDGLGPRFVDWWNRKPLPVDADLLQEVVSGFRPPSRVCPPDARSKLADNELTLLRKLARPLPTHFVVGRNRKLQGLAAAILKLWEKSHIVKIAIKWGVPNTDNEQMAKELKSLTGGVLLLRNKFYIIMYRGTDFLPRKVASVVADRVLELKAWQVHEEVAREKANKITYPPAEPLGNFVTSGSLSEFQNICKMHEDLQNGKLNAEVQIEAEKEKLMKELRQQERKLFVLRKKIERSAKALLKLSSACQPAELEGDLEILTDEERECFRKIGLKMGSCLALGRRGIFDGVMEGIHQHWKHREVVKVISMQRLFYQVIFTAKSLEAESGGILVSVEKLKQGHAIIIYRGKNYKRPLKLIRGNLLNKRAALSRSIEMQRIGSLKFFAYQRQQAIMELRDNLVAKPGKDQVTIINYHEILSKNVPIRFCDTLNLEGGFALLVTVMQADLRKKQELDSKESWHSEA